MTAQRRWAPVRRIQTQLYYARRRNRSLRNDPRLYRNAAFAPGAVETGNVENLDLDRPVTFGVKVDLSAPGLAFSWGSDVVLQVAANQLQLTLPVGTVEIPHPGEGQWLLVLSIRPGDGALQLWNQFDSLWRSENLSLGGSWASPDQTLTVGTGVLSYLSIYTAQLPRHFGAEGEALGIGSQPVVEDLWLNSTALFFMTGFPTPLFESDT